MKTIKELEAESKLWKGDNFQTELLMTEVRLQTLKDVLGLIDEILKEKETTKGFNPLEELKVRIKGISYKDISRFYYRTKQYQ